MYYRELECPEYESINAEILAWIDSLGGLSSSTSFWNPAPINDFVKQCPQMISWLIKNQLMIRSIAITYGIHANCCGPHTDSPPARFKLSWPVKNCTNTFNRWFRPCVPSPASQINNLGGTQYTSIDDLEEITRREVTGPALIDAGTIHDVWFSPDAVPPRIGLQCQLMKEPSSL